MPAKTIEQIDEYLLPQALYDDEAKIRCAGFEFEYAGVEPETVILALKDRFGGEIDKINDFHFKLKTDLGTFKVMIDAQFLLNSQLRKWVNKYKLDGFIDLETVKKIEKLIATVGEQFVPFELTTPPMKFTALGYVDEVKTILQSLGAKGTKSSPVYAFGMHINPQVRSLEVTQILSDLCAFFVLYEYIVEWLKPDLSRRITPYIDPFDAKYRRLVLDTSYQPSMRQFIEDYLHYNPTRNRALDMLPLLCYIDEEKVRSRLPDEKIGKRPTYHYRLPDSCVDEERWTPAIGFNSWMLVEMLSSNVQLLHGLSNRCIQYLDRPLGALEKEEWIKEVKSWVESLWLRR